TNFGLRTLEALEIVRSERPALGRPGAALAPVFNESELAHDLFELRPAAYAGEVAHPHDPERVGCRGVLEQHPEPECLGGARVVAVMSEPERMRRLKPRALHLRVHHRSPDRLACGLF